MIALVIFAKTPGVSEPKTRLAAGIGQTRAREFYQLCLNCWFSLTREMATDPEMNMEIIWSLAEAGASKHPFWKGHRTLEQDGNTLAERLYSTQEKLPGYSHFVFVGTDSPQISGELLAKTQELLLASRENFVLGPAKDGGFYLLGGARRLSLSDWQSVPYSQPNTSREMTVVLSKLGKVQLLPSLVDVDEVKDLPLLKQELQTLELPRPESRKPESLNLKLQKSDAQEALLQWLRSN